MNKWIIIRAGNTAWQEEDRIQGTVPLPLSDEGKQSLNEIARQLEPESFDCIYSSGNESSGATAKYLARRCGLKTKKMYDLHEVDFGLWQGLRMDDIKTRFASQYRLWRQDPTSICPPQGESIALADQRVGEAMELLKKKNRDNTVVIVAARMVAALIECRLIDMPLSNLWQVAEQAQTVQTYTFSSEKSSTEKLTVAARVKKLSPAETVDLADTKPSTCKTTALIP